MKMGVNRLNPVQKALDSKFLKKKLKKKIFKSTLFKIFKKIKSGKK